MTKILTKFLFALILGVSLNQTVFAVTWGPTNAIDCAVPTTLTTLAVDQGNCDFLEKVYTTTNGVTWTNNTNWGTLSDVETWFGISRSGGNKITHLDLNNNNLVGDISSWNLGGGSLINLVKFQISNNQLTGNVGAWNITSLINLVDFGFSHNQLTGDIGGWNIAPLTNLVYFQIQINQLTGDIGGWDITPLTNLVNFIISSNQLTGDIGNWNITPLTNLVYFQIQTNQLTGDIGGWNITPLTNLINFIISNNQLTGDIGGWNIGPLTNLVDFGFSDNQLTGDIGNWNISSLTNLVYFQIQTNQLTGDIGSWNISSLTNLVNFIISSNQLTGDISSWNISSLTNLVYFQIQTNQLTGDIGSWNISLLTNLVNFIISNNQLTGDISGWNIGNGNLNSLVAFQIYNNQLTGDISGWNIGNGNLSSLVTFQIYNNQLTGDVSGWNIGNGNLSSLSYFYIGGNSLTGDVSGWNIGNGNLSNLVTFQISNNSLTGNISGWNLGGGNLTNLGTFYISNNSLTGDISGWNLGGGGLISLINLAISSNNLTGDISSWNLGGGNLTNLTYFSIGNNNLTGGIYSWNLGGGNLSNLAGFHIYSNLFIFSDIEPDIVAITAVTNHTYNPQAKIDTVRSIIVKGGNTLIITPQLAINPSGNDSYEWFKDGVSLGVTSTAGRIYNKIGATDSADSGVYTYQVTNAQVPNLTLYSNNISVIVDEVLPVLTATVGTSLPHDINNPELLFSATDNTGIDHYEVEYILNNNVGGVSGITTIINPATSPIVLDLDPDENTHTVIIRAYDLAGNIQIVTLKFPPIVTFSTPYLKNTILSTTQVTITSPGGHNITAVNITDAGGTGATLGTCTPPLPGTSPTICDISGITSTGIIKVQATDAIGAIGENSQTYTIDTVDPIITITSNTKVKNSSITDTTILITDNNGINAASVVLGAGTTATTSNFNCTQLTASQVSCTISIDGAINTGIQDLGISATDLAGNNVTLTETGYIIDTIAPGAPVLTGISGDTGISSTDEITSDQTLIFSGTAEANSIVDIYGEPDAFGIRPLLGTTTTDGLGNFNFDYTGITLVEGTYTFTAKATDLAGNKGSESSVLTIVIDTNAPNAPVISTPTNGNTVKGTGEAGSVMVLTTPSSSTCTTTVLANGTYQCTLAPNPVDGEDISASQTDTAGNISPITTVNGGIDTVAPIAPTCTTTPSPANNGTNITTTCTGVETNAIITISDMSCGVEVGNQVICTGTIGTGVGEITVSNDMVTIKDVAGNSNSTATTNLVIDNTSPTITTPPTVSVPGDTTTTLTWQTDELTSSKVIYGLTTTTDQTTGETDVSPRVTSHIVQLTNLLSCTKYFYKTVSTDTAGNVFTGDINNFTTTDCVGGEAPVAATTTAVVGTAGGGIVTLNEVGSDKVELDIPVGYNTTKDADGGSACTTGAYFQLKQLNEPPVIATLGNAISGGKAVNTYELSAYCNPDERVLAFDQALTVTMHYTAADIEGLETSSLKMFRYNIPTTAWEELNNCSVDNTTNTVTCETTHFSTFGIFGSFSSVSRGGSAPTRTYYPNVELKTPSKLNEEGLHSSAPEKVLSCILEDKNIGSIKGLKEETAYIKINREIVESETTILETYPAGGEIKKLIVTHKPSVELAGKNINFECGVRDNKNNPSGQQYRIKIEDNISENLHKSAEDNSEVGGIINDPSENNNTCKKEDLVRYPLNRGKGLKAGYFEDADKNDITFKYAKDLAEQNIIHGDAETHDARLDDKVARAEAAKTVSRAAQYTVEISGECLKNDFPDVIDNSWYHRYVQKLEEKNIVHGYDDGFYRPSKSINKIELYKIISITFGFVTKEEAQSRSEKEDTPWFIPYEEELEERNIIPNWIENMSYTQELTRGDVFAIISRTLAYLDKVEIK